MNHNLTVTRNRILSRLWRPVGSLYHYFSYSTGGFLTTEWQGVLIQKCPTDMWLYHDIIRETLPDVLVETGTNQGGSALFFAHMFDLLKTGGRVITVDVATPAGGYPKHERIQFLCGSSVSSEILATIRAQIRPTDRVMVTLDSDHSARHVRQELELYSPLVAPGCYLVVEDTNVYGHPVARTHGPGPMEALTEFLSTRAGSKFKSDLSRDAKFGFTFFPKGWLRRETSEENRAS